MARQLEKAFCPIPRGGSHSQDRASSGKPPSRVPPQNGPASNVAPPPAGPAPRPLVAPVPPRPAVARSAAAGAACPSPTLQ